MSKIDGVKQILHDNRCFFHDAGTNHIRILDTPHIWGLPFGEQIMPQARIRQSEFERAIVEIVQKARYRCDVSSLNSPDPDWGKAIVGARDTALTTRMGRTQPTQFRFLFGQTPITPIGEPWNLIDFKAALVRLVRARSAHWEMMPEIWVGRFYEFQAGIFAALGNKILPSGIIGDASDGSTKMTWNHSKIIAVDGVESLVGGHNLNMDLFRSYPPVHDVSVVVHGGATYGSQLFLNEMWTAGTDLFTKQSLDIGSLTWHSGDSNRNLPVDPLTHCDVTAYMVTRQHELSVMHQKGQQPGTDPVVPSLPPLPSVNDIRAYDLRTLDDLEAEVFQERAIYNAYDKLDEYKEATRMLSVGKYWSSTNANDFKKGSELMKQYLIMNARSTIRMSQMDLISAWKKNWSDHVVCHWIMDSLLQNKSLKVQIVVSPLDAGAGAEGDQYSFGSGAVRTFNLIKYYMTHDANTDALLNDHDGARNEALTRLFVAPLYYTNQVPHDKRTEGTTYKWPNLSADGYTNTLKQKPLSQEPPQQGIIGHPLRAVEQASGYFGAPVASAPGNHAKIMIIDDEAYVVGSDNLYPGNLSEFNYLVEGPAVQELLHSYWTPLWRYSGPHAFTGPSGGGGTPS